jgi:hypothetical protein
VPGFVLNGWFRRTGKGQFFFFRFLQVVSRRGTKFAISIISYLKSIVKQARIYEGHSCKQVWYLDGETCMISLEFMVIIM